MSSSEDEGSLTPRLFCAQEGRRYRLRSAGVDLIGTIEQTADALRFISPPESILLRIEQLAVDSEGLLAGVDLSLGDFELVASQDQSLPLTELYPALAGPLLALFDELDRAVHALGQNVQRTEKKKYIAYGRPKQFLKVLPQRDRLYLHLIGVAGSLHDPLNLRDPNTLAPLYENEHVALKNVAELNDVMSLVTQAYEKRT